ncbi:hypothetical protein BJX96DRAFT_152132 [Aspergillus floccosus]
MVGTISHTYLWYEEEPYLERSGCRKISSSAVKSGRCPYQVSATRILLISDRRYNAISPPGNFSRDVQDNNFPPRPFLLGALGLRYIFGLNRQMGHNATQFMDLQTKYLYIYIYICISTGKATLSNAGVYE